MRNDITQEATTSRTTERFVPVTEITSETLVVSSTTPESTTNSESFSYTTLEQSSTSLESTSESASTISINEPTSDPSLTMVDNTATEILFTTAPASSSSTESSPVTFTRVPNIPAVSQPRPFGFPRRGRPTTVTPSTSSAPPVTEQTRSKVSSRPTRNFARSSNAYRLRGRTRPSTSSLLTFSSTESLPTLIDDSSHLDDDEKYERDDETRTTVSKSRVASTRRRGTSRYTPPSFGTIEDETVANSIPSRRGHLRTSSPTETTEQVLFEENSVLPVSRGRTRSRTTTSTSPSTEYSSATESNRKRGRPSYNLSTLASSTGSNEPEDSPIIRIVQDKNTESKLDGSSGRSIRDRITNIKIFKKLGEEPLELPTFKEDTATTSPVFYVTQELLTPTSSNSVINDDNEPKQSENDTTIGKENITVNSTTEGNDLAIDSTTAIMETSKATMFKGSTSNSIINGTVKPVRRKVLRRRRPIELSTTVSTVTADEEKTGNETNEGVKRRKVIGRLQPLAKNSTPTPRNVTNNATEEQGRNNAQLFSRSTTTKSDLDTSKVKTEAANIDVDTKTPFTIIVVTPRNDESLENTTLSLGDFTINVSDDYNDDNESTLLPTTIADMDKLEITNRTIESPETIVDKLSDNNSTQTELMSTTESLNNSASTESTLGNDDSGNPTIAFSTESSMATTLQLRATNVPTTIVTDPTSRFIRKKFVRKRPASSTPATFTNVRRSNSPRYSNRSGQLNDLDGLSNRRKSLYVRRRPVASTTTSTTTAARFDDEFDSEIEDEENLRDGEDAKKKNNQINSMVTTQGDDFWKRYTTPSTTASATLSVPLIGALEDIFTAPMANDDKQSSSDSEEEYTNTNLPLDVKEEEPVEIIYRRADQRRKFKVPQSLKKDRTISYVDSTTQTSSLIHPIFDSSPEESSELKNHDDNLKTKIVDYRQPRTRFGNDNADHHEDDKFIPKFKLPISKKDRANSDNVELDLAFSLTQNGKNRSYPKRVSSTTEQAITETLIPAKKFDYVADAILRKQQSQRTTPRYEETSKMLPESKNSGSVDENFVEYDFTTRPNKPQITRLVTSVVESGTTERQIIHIKTKYSSLTSTTWVPALSSHSINDNRYKNVGLSQVGGTDDSYNEIHESTERSPEKSTLSIESEFARENRITTEPTAESWTIEIESVFSNIINRESRT